MEILHTCNKEEQIEGGWRDDGSVKIISGDIYTFGARIIDSEVVLDPLFWQALGKALGWEEEIIERECAECWGKWYEKEWLYRAHQYFDLVLTGGDTEKFWKELLHDDEVSSTKAH